MRFNFHPFQWFSDKFDTWRINKWLQLRAKGKPNNVALTQALLSPKRAVKILDGILNNQGGVVGLMVVSGGRISSASNFDVVDTALKGLGYICSALPKAEQEKLKFRLMELTNHNWGYWRRGAQAALAIIDAEEAKGDHTPQEV